RSGGRRGQPGRCGRRGRRGAVRRVSRRPGPRALAGMGSPGKRTRPDEDLEAWLAAERSPAFEKALARLLAAHHSALLQARRGRREEEGDLSPGTQTSCQASWSPSPRACLGSGRRGADHKGPDKPVRWLSSERERGGASCAESHGAVGLQGGGQENASACGSSESPRPAVADSRPSVEVSLRITDHIILQSQPSHRKRSWLGEFVDGVVFEVGSAVVLFLFCLVTALEIQGEGMTLGYELEYPRYADPDSTAWPNTTDVLQVLSVCFGGIFACEVLFRLLAAKAQFFCDGWNLFDVFILVGWCIELTGEDFNAKVLRLARLVRMLRFLRLVKVVRYVENLYYMVRALNGCWKALGWSAVLLLALQAFTSVVISQILFATYFLDDRRPIDERQEVFVYFGSFTRSLLTTFEMTMGNWPTPARVLFENVSEWYMWMFLLHKFVVGFAVIGVINAMFVQETFQVAMTDDLTMVLKKSKQMRTQKAKLERLFMAADSDGNGRVSRNEFATILMHDDVRLWLASMDYATKDPNFLFDLLDQNDSGDLSASEFLRGMTRLRGFARAMDLVHLGNTQEKVKDIVGVSHKTLGKLLGPVDDDYDVDDDWGLSL
ncbi:unnamed protein product, partial [Prorocentrum cordatum]